MISNQILKIAVFALALAGAAASGASDNGVDMVSNTQDPSLNAVAEGNMDQTPWYHPRQLFPGFKDCFNTGLCSYIGKALRDNDHGDSPADQVARVLTEDNEEGSNPRRRRLGEWMTYKLVGSGCNAERDDSFYLNSLGPKSSVLTKQDAYNAGISMCCMNNHGFQVKKFTTIFGTTDYWWRCGDNYGVY